MIVALDHSPFLVACVGVKQKHWHCPHHRPFSAKAYVILTLLLCDWSFQQTATKPQTQWKGMLFGCEQPFLWGERCVTSQKTAAEETKNLSPCTKINSRTRLYNAAASPASRPRSAGSLAIKIIQYVMQISEQSNVVVARQWIAHALD